MKVSNKTRSKELQPFKDAMSDLEIRFFSAKMPSSPSNKESCKQFSYHGNLAVIPDFNPTTLRTNFIIEGDMVANDFLYDGFARICKKTDDGSDNQKDFRFDIELSRKPWFGLTLVIPCLPLYKGDKVLFARPMSHRTRLIEMLSLWSVGYRNRILLYEAMKKIWNTG
jgi:hypothetical protein